MSRSMSMRARRALSLLVAGVLGLVLALVSPPAQAYGESGKLYVRGPGQAYAGSGALVSITTTPGALASFSFKVKNTGTYEAQYNLKGYVYQHSCGTSCTYPTMSMTSGALQTKLHATYNGYYTPPIAPGQSAIFTYRVQVPADASPRQIYRSFLSLNDTSGIQLDNVSLDVNVRATTGTAANDIYVTGSGQQPTSHNPAGMQPNVTNPSFALGTSSAYSVKLMNGSTAPSQIRFHLESDNGCTAFFAPTVKAGYTDVTTAARNGTYLTPVLAPTKFVTLTVTVKYTSTLGGCGATYSRWRAHSIVAGSTKTVYLVQNPTAP